MIFYSSIGKYPLNLTKLLESVDSKLSNSRGSLSSVRCGSTSNLRAMITSLEQIREFLVNYDTAYQLFNQTFQNITNKFNTTIYTKIITESILTNNTVDFLNTYNSYVDDLSNHFE